MINMAKKKENSDFKIVASVKGSDMKCDTWFGEWWEKVFCDFMINWFVQLWFSFLDSMELTDNTKLSILSKWSRYIAMEAFKIQDNKKE